MSRKNEVEYIWRVRVRCDIGNRCEMGDELWFVRSSVSNRTSWSVEISLSFRILYVVAF